MNKIENEKKLLANGKVEIGRHITTFIGVGKYGIGKITP